MPEYIVNALAQGCLYLAVILPIIIIAYGVCKPSVIKNVQKMDGYIYRAYIVIIFCCAAQIISGLQDAAFAADTHVIVVMGITGIFQNLMFLTILRCMSNCAQCGEFKGDEK